MDILKVVDNNSHNRSDLIDLKVGKELRIEGIRSPMEMEVPSRNKYSKHLLKVNSKLCK